MRLPVIPTLVLAAILSVGVAAPAYAADPVLRIDYSLDASDSQYTGGNFVDGDPSTECAIAPGADLRYYTVEPFHVDVAGDYAPVDLVWAPTGGLVGDGALAIYTAAPDADDLEASCLFGTDDGIGRTVPLDAYTTYYLVLSSSEPGAVGSFSFDVTGPGELTLGAYTTVIDYVLETSDPTFAGFQVSSGVPCDFYTETGTNRHYRVVPFSVDATGSYEAEDLWVDDDGGLAIYSAIPELSELGASCMASVDDGPVDVQLTADTTYYMLQTSYDEDATGSYSYRMAGPGIVTVGVLPSATTTSLAASPTSATVGTAIEFTATVTGDNPTGTVEFIADGSTLGTAPTASGSATLSVSTLPVGSHSITARYSGDATNAASTATALSVTVTAAPVLPGATTTTLSSSAVSAEAGTAIEFTATVTGTGPTGDVEFFAGATSLGTAATSSGVATLSTTTLAVGDHQITARYAGDANNESSISGALIVTVTAAAVAPRETTTALSASASSAAVGTAIEFTATVTGTEPTGDVEFFAGATSLGTAATSSGVATLSTTTLAVGDHQITARYAGDANNAPSSATAITITVRAAATPTPSVPPTTAPAAPRPSSTPTAALPETGSNPLPAGIAALLLLTLGGVTLLARQRRRDTAS